MLLDVRNCHDVVVFRSLGHDCQYQTRLDRQRSSLVGDVPLSAFGSLLPAAGSAAGMLIVLDVCRDYQLALSLRPSKSS